MQDVRHEIWRDPEHRRLWGLEMLDQEIIGCIGPFREETALPERLDTFAFERNAELLRWLRRRRRQRLPRLNTAAAPAG